jgi:hypothetical protein
MDLMTTQNAIEGLNNLAIGEKTLTVRIATNNTGAPPSQIMTHMQNINMPGLGNIFQGRWIYTCVCLYINIYIHIHIHKCISMYV